MSEKTYTLYMHVNKTNYKKYIGITSQPVSRRWRSQGQGYKMCVLFNRAIQKYGWDNFEHLVLEENLTEEEAKNEEKRLIAFYKSNDKKYGYNIMEGGQTQHLPEESIQKMKETKRKNPQQFNHDKLSAGQKRKWQNMSEEDRKRFCKKMREVSSRPEIRKARSKFFNSDRNPRLQPVQCIETGQCYLSSKDAATAMGGNVSTFHKLWSGWQKTAWGYHWKKITLEEYYECNPR